MKRLREENINTSEYFDNQFEEKQVDKINTLRQECYLKHVKPGDLVVELGCGVSYFPEMARLKGARSFGLDFSQKAIEMMSKKFPDVGYVLGDATNTNLGSDIYDVVVSGEVIEHLEKPKELVKEMVRICRQNGKIIISTPHLEFDDPEHLWEFDEKDLYDLLSPHGETEIERLESEKFPGRFYLVAVCKKFIYFF